MKRGHFDSKLHKVLKKSISEQSSINKRSMHLGLIHVPITKLVWLKFILNYYVYQNSKWTSLQLTPFFLAQFHHDAVEESTDYCDHSLHFVRYVILI